MTVRRMWLCIVFLLCACGPAAAPGPPRLPDSVGKWKLSTGPERVPAGWRYTYSGPPDIALTLEERSSETVAFDALQKWRAEAGKLAFYKGRYFGIAESPGTDHRSLSAFVSSVKPSVPAR